MSRLWALMFLLTISSAQTAKILGLFTLPSDSHFGLAHALLRELESRGHEVTMVSPYSIKDPPANYHEVVLTDVNKLKGGTMAAILDESKSVMTRTYELYGAFRYFERLALADKELIKFLDTKPQFDLVIQLWYNTEALLGVGHAVNATTIGFSVMPGSPCELYQTSNPTPYSYVSNIYLPYSESMNFLQRLSNTLGHVWMALYMHFSNMPFQRGILKEYFPNAPSLDELMREVNLIFVNTHYSTVIAKPRIPGIIEIGGFDLGVKQELTDDLKAFMDTSKYGVILFSLGTSIIDSDIQSSVLKEIVLAFKNTKYDILWKYGTHISNLPKNVKTLNWIPQKAVLAHKKLKAFITNGGFGSITEAVYYAVPLIGFPLFSDQPKNFADIVARGFGITLDLNRINAKRLGDAINEITSNVSYANNIQYYSDLLRNQEMNPMDKAVYWAEHAIKHKGSKYLRPKGSDLPWYQYMLLDVIGFIAFVVLLIGIIFLYGVKKLWQIYCSKKSSIKKVKAE